jgi:hypothetical protein
MRYLHRLICAAVVVGFAMATSTFAQQGQSTTVGGKTTTTLSGTGGLAGGGQGGLGGGTAGGGQLGGTSLVGMEAAPSITAPGTTGGGSTVLAASNVFAATSGNPMYQGTPTNAKSNAAPGGLGAPLYPTSAGNAVGGAGGIRAAGGRTGGTFGGAGGIGTTDQFGIIVPQTVAISYPALIRFPTTPLAPSQVQADVAGMISRSTMIANPAGVQVTVDGTTVILRGSAKDEDEARMIANMARLAPGVRAVKNELTFPKP